MAQVGPTKFLNFLGSAPEGIHRADVLVEGLDTVLHDVELSRAVTRSTNSLASASLIST